MRTVGGMHGECAYYSCSLLSVFNNAQYLHGPSIDEPAIMSIGNNSYYYVHDILGSIIALTDENGQVVVRYEYDAWGNIMGVKGGDIKNPYRYTGREYDSESGLYYYRARYYDAVVGRFISKDPLQSAWENGENLYVYVGNNPIKYSDPYGQWATPGWMCLLIARNAAQEANNNYKSKTDKWKHAYVGCKLRQGGCSYVTTWWIAVGKEIRDWFDYRVYDPNDAHATIAGWWWGSEGHYVYHGWWKFRWREWVYDPCNEIIDKHEAAGEL